MPVGELNTPVTPFALDDRPRRFGVGVVEAALVGDRRGAGHQRGIDDVAVADHPADVRGRPPRVALAKPEHPVAHRGDVDGIPAMGVDGELRLRGRAGGREDERRVLRGRVLDGARLPLPCPEEVVPRQLAVPRRAGRVRPPQDDDALDVARPGIDGVVDDREEVDVLALAVGDVRRQDEARAARPDPLAQRAGAEAGEDDAVDRPDPDGREHRDDRLGRSRHVDRQAVALADPEAAQARRRPARPRRAAPRT